MLLKYFYDEALAHASYLVGCQQAEVAIIVDPGRDIDPYLALAQQKGMRVIAVAETHIHADYVSGARELAERVGAKLYLSDEGPDDWKYQFAADYDSQLLHDGDRFMIGKLQFETVHTPGHTPESLSFLLTDQGGGANEPMGIFTGDFVFVGSIGRPDLLEEAAQVEGSAKAGAHDLFRSMQQFRKLPDHLQVWPAHGAGSACGKGLGAVPSSTVGYEKLFNPALQFDDEEAFVQYILADQPEAPKYFALMKRVNKEGPAIVGEHARPDPLDVKQLASLARGAGLIDVSPAAQYGEAHVPESINIPLAMLADWGGWLINYSKPVYLITATAKRHEAIRILRKIGVETIAGTFDAAAVRQAGLATQHYRTADPQEVHQQVDAQHWRLIDVRSQVEWNAGHLPGAEHHFLGRLPEQLRQIPKDKPVVTQCGSGLRSAIAASLLQSAGIEAINLRGGYRGWTQAGLPTVKDEATVSAS
jgi:hydroxyacylglutathione hydrolase